jgi:two-component system, OmpR family, sensor histidine kinase MprB
VAERHAGSVQAAENVGGGARLVLKLPGTEKVDA